MLTIGIDDAGRGPLIGPMILAGVLLTREQEKYLKLKNVRDSKDVIQKDRVQMAKIINEKSVAHKIVKSFPDEIDGSLENGVNLNTLEAMKTAEIINELNISTRHKEKINVILDCPSVNTSAWQETMMKYVKYKNNLDVRCEHKADVNHVSAAAGSILAKVAREEEVAKIKKRYGEIGSGYPSDPITKEFLKRRGKELSESGIFRKTWSTWKKLFPGRK